ncbi:MAG: 4-hydroxy-tetrahydrodipicolinate reductase [Planctomycetaceae bacterium]|jgi:4-hydroxy-tetrahydrodipicolinate reductase|nr:4-hydroxy-tetrahydrodipicolinate reductase [Planctomycetaceae bacterium]
MSESKIKVAVSGAAGRMGRRLVAIIAADEELELSAALESESHDKIGTDAGELAGVGRLGVNLSASIDSRADVLIDFSTPQATDYVIKSCIKFGIPLVFATTGVTLVQDIMLENATCQIPVLMSPSMSLMVNLAMELCKTSAKTLADKDVDIEIVESHHRYKTDAPSGTALKFAKIISKEMGQFRQVCGRRGQVGKRTHEEIGFHSIRIGDDPGKHSILFGLLGETLEISVKATSRDCYAYGAIAAAKFLYNKPIGKYKMTDLLFKK